MPKILTRLAEAVVRILAHLRSTVAAADKLRQVAETDSNPAVAAYTVPVVAYMVLADIHLVVAVAHPKNK